MSVEVKICGCRTAGPLQTAIKAGADYAGFVFYPPSPRHITLDTARALRSLVPEPVRKVALIVNAEDEAIDLIMAALDPDILQAHGAETPERIREIAGRFGRPVWKALAVSGPQDIEGHRRYDGAADLILFDAKPPKGMKNALPGGNALSFDWRLLAQASIDMPWGLAGGLKPDNVAEAIAVTGTGLVDTSSGVERAPGVKDEALIEAFIRAAGSPG